MADFKSLTQFYSDIIVEKLLEVDAKVSQIYIVNDENIKTLIDDHKNLHVGFRFKRGPEEIIFGLMAYISQAQGEDKQ